MDGQVLNSSQANYVDDYWDEEQLLLHYHFFGEAGHPQHGNPQFPIDEALARQLQEGDWDSPVDEALARQLQELDGVWDGTDDDALALQLLEMQNSLGTMSLSRPRRTATRPEKTLHGSSSSSAANQDNIDIDNMTYEEISQLQESIGEVSKGLSKEVMSRLPTYKYKSSRRGRKLKDDDIKCVICQTEFSNGDKLIALSCLHKFHDECIRGWFKNEKTCCICKEEVDV
ncbi:unnamed protein product [Linum tenue]|uniref:RING-type domain-containing protein n=1 Tax=Linum tenue TaxID=586396 RepID=A0AAV0QRN9_9ROSI|nr:unnamed protein product [Linum tenue]